MSTRLASFALVATVVAGCGPSGPDVSKLRTPEEVRDAYIKAADANDTATMAKLADVPWLDTNRQVVRDRDALPKAMERAAAQVIAPEKRKVEMVAYKTLRDEIKDEADRKILDELLGDDGHLVSIENEGNPLQERVLLVRVKDGQARVVGGPLKPNQLNPTNRIPDTVQKAFEKPETFELYSLNPEERQKQDEKPADAKDDFHGWKVLGKTEVKAAEDRKKLIDAVCLGVEDNSGMVAGCFIPRHGIRMKSGTDTIDLVICFQCMSVNVYVNGKQEKGFLITGGPQPAFDSVLKAAGVKLPRQSGE